MRKKQKLFFYLLLSVYANAALSGCISNEEIYFYKRAGYLKICGYPNLNGSKNSITEFVLPDSVTTLQSKLNDVEYDSVSNCYFLYDTRLVTSTNNFLIEIDTFQFHISSIVDDTLGDLENNGIKNIKLKSYYINKQFKSDSEFKFFRQTSN